MRVKPKCWRTQKLVDAADRSLLVRHDNYDEMNSSLTPTDLSETPQNARSLRSRIGISSLRITAKTLLRSMSMDLSPVPRHRGIWLVRCRREKGTQLLGGFDPAVRSKPTPVDQACPALHLLGSMTDLVDLAC